MTDVISLARAAIESDDVQAMREALQALIRLTKQDREQMQRLEDFVSELDE